VGVGGCVGWSFTHFTAATTCYGDKTAGDAATAVQQQQQLHSSAAASEIAPAISIIRRERDIHVGITMCGAALAEQSAALSKINTRCQRLNAPQTHPRVFFLPRVAALPYGLISMLFLFFFRLANCASAR